MRRLSQTAVLLALTACMSPSGKTKRSVEVSAAESDDPRPTPPGLPEVAASQTVDGAAEENGTTGAQPPASTQSPGEIKESRTESLPVDPNCQVVKREDPLPAFLPQAQVYVRQIAKPCLTPSGEEGIQGNAKIIASGIPCAQSFGRLNRLYESSISRPDTIKFRMPLNCLAIPDQDTPKKFLEAHLLPEYLQKLAAFYPIQVNYWEFKETPDQGFDDALTLRSEQGRDRFVKWWAQDAGTIPVRVFGRESSMIPSDDVYEAQIKILKRKGSQFQVQVDSIRLLEPSDVEQVFNRCKEKNNVNACTAAFK